MLQIILQMQIFESSFILGFNLPQGQTTSVDLLLLYDCPLKKESWISLI